VNLANPDNPVSHFHASPRGTVSPLCLSFFPADEDNDPQGKNRITGLARFTELLEQRIAAKTLHKITSIPSIAVQKTLPLSRHTRREKLIQSRDQVAISSF